MKARRLGRRSGVLACALATALGAASPAFGAFPGQNGKLVFASDREGLLHNYVMNEDGSDQTPVTGLDNVVDAVWSADGRMLAFTTGTPDPELFITRSDGTGRVQLTDNELGESDPAWSPDGRIAFARQNELLVMDSDGTDIKQLTRGESERYTDIAWSPDGRQIAFTVHNPPSYRIDVVDADGTNRRTLRDRSEHPNWSPDGQQIAFVAPFRWHRGPIIGVMNADGSDQRDLNVDGLLPVWSPDGRKIAFTANPLDVYVMNADGTGVTQLTHSPWIDQLSDWQPLVPPGSSPPTTNPPTNPPTPPRDATQPRDTAGPAMTISSGTVRATRRGVAAVRMGCPAGEPAGCSGRLSLRTASRVRRRRVTLGTASFRVPAGRTAAVEVRLSRANRRLLSRLRRVRVIASARAVDQAGNARTTTAPFLLVARQR